MKKYLTLFLVLVVTGLAIYSYKASSYAPSRSCKGNILLVIGKHELVVPRQPGPYIELEGSPESFRLASDRSYSCDVKRIERVTNIRWPELWIKDSNEQYSKLKSEHNIPDTPLNTPPGIIGCLDPIRLRPPVTRCQGSYKHPSGLFIKYFYSAKGDNPKAQYSIFEEESRKRVQTMLEKAKTFDAE